MHYHAHTQRHTIHGNLTKHSGVQQLPSCETVERCRKMLLCPLWRNCPESIWMPCPSWRRMVWQYPKVIKLNPFLPYFKAFIVSWKSLSSWNGCQGQARGRRFPPPPSVSQLDRVEGGRGELGQVITLVTVLYMFITDIQITLTEIIKLGIYPLSSWSQVLGAGGSQPPQRPGLLWGQNREGKLEAGEQKLKTNQKNSPSRCRLSTPMMPSSTHLWLDQSFRWRLTIAFKFSFQASLSKFVWCPINIILSRPWLSIWWVRVLLQWTFSFSGNLQVAFQLLHIRWHASTLSVMELKKTCPNFLLFSSWSCYWIPYPYK